MAKTYINVAKGRVILTAVHTNGLTISVVRNVLLEGLVEGCRCDAGLLGPNFRWHTQYELVHDRSAAFVMTASPILPGAVITT